VCGESDDSAWIVGQPEVIQKRACGKRKGAVRKRVKERFTRGARIGVTGCATGILEMGNLSHMSDIGRVARQIKRQTLTRQQALAAIYNHEDPHAFCGSSGVRCRND
jgi:hypothetical protein